MCMECYGTGIIIQSFSYGAFYQPCTCPIALENKRQVEIELQEMLDELDRVNG